MPVRRRHIDDPADRPRRRVDPVDLPMIRLDRIQIAVEGNHAAPGTVRLEVVLIRTRNRVRLLERTQVRDLCHRPFPFPRRIALSTFA